MATRARFGSLKNRYADGKNNIAMLFARGSTRVIRTRMYIYVVKIADFPPTSVCDLPKVRKQLHVGREYWVESLEGLHQTPSAPCLDLTFI